MRRTTLFVLILHSLTTFCVAGPLQEKGEIFCPEAVDQQQDQVAFCQYNLKEPSWPSHPPKVKYSLRIGTLCPCVCIGLPGPAHPPKVKYSLKSISVACCLCGYECIGLPGPAHLPTVNYSLKARISFR